jgi:uncharacterized delta-60 repeat protein
MASANVGTQRFWRWSEHRPLASARYDARMGKPRAQSAYKQDRSRLHTAKSLSKLLTLCLWTACGFPRPADVVPEGDDSDFTIALDTDPVHLVEGGNTAVGVSLTRNGLMDPVIVNISGLPPGVTADPLIITRDTGTLTLHAAVGARQGVSTPSVITTGGSIEHSNPLSLLTTGAPGTLDQSFGAGGAAAALSGHARAVLIQPDGKIVIAGQAIASNNSVNLMLTRYLSDGTIDSDFSGGTVTFDAVALLPVAVALQSDGKLVVVSEFGTKGTRCLVIRVDSHGNLDDSFGNAGKKLLPLSDTLTQYSSVDAVLVQPDGNILIAGFAQSGETTDTPATTHAMLARLTPAGELDASFGTNGRTVTRMGGDSARFAGLALQPDGRIVAVGWTESTAGSRTPALARFDIQGDLDTSFSGDGFFTVDPGQLPGSSFEHGASLAIQPDGKIVAAGDFGTSGIGTSGTLIVRLHGANGAVDTQFGNQGIGRVTLVGADVNFATSLALQRDGKFLIAGQVKVSPYVAAFVARLNINLLIDRDFSGGVATPAMTTIATPYAEFHAMAQDDYGRIVAVGSIAGSPDQLLVYRFWP